ncbi:MAG: hypothetical protein OEY23_01740 [Acidimicrobiia bacterium]|nr:hypothetical protein [Acidimicrobiia bacterium]
MWRRPAAILAIAAALTAACGSGTGTSASPSNATGANTDSQEAQTSPNGPIMVAGAERDTLALVDPADGSARAIDHPAHLVGEPAFLSGTGGPDGVYALAVTPEDAFVFHVETGTVQNSVPLGDLLGVSPSPDPEAALFSHEEQLTVVDLRTGRLIDVGGSDPGLARLRVDAGSRRAVVSRGSGGGELVDLERGTSKRLADDLLLIGDGLDHEGRRVFVARRGSSEPLERQLLVVGFDDPESSEVWYESATVEAQLTGYAWSGDVIVAVDLAGRVLVLDGTEPEQIGTLGDGGTGPSRVYGAADTGAVLVSRSDRTGERWHRVDPSSRDVQPLPELDGLEPLGDERLPSALILGEGDGAVEWSRLVVVPIENADAIEIMALDAPQPLVVSAVGGGLVMITRVDFRRREYALVDARDGSIAGEGTSAGAVVLSPDLAHMAVTPDIRRPTAVVRAIADDAPARELGEGEAIAWLRSPG